MLVNKGAKIDMTTKLSRKTWYEKVASLIKDHHYPNRALSMVEAKALTEFSTLCGTERDASGDNFVLQDNDFVSYLRKDEMAIFSS